MAAPKQGITVANFHAVDLYFFNQIKLNRLFLGAQLDSLSKLYDAKQAYLKLPSIDWKTNAARVSSEKIRRKALQHWVDEFIPPAKWQRCLLTLRQNKSRKKLKLKRLDLQDDVYSAVKKLASKWHLSLGETVMKAVTRELNRAKKTATLRKK